MAAFEDKMVDVQQALTKRSKAVKMGIFKDSFAISRDLLSADGTFLKIYLRQKAL